MTYEAWKRRPYKLARQQHLGEFLDYLRDLGSLTYHLRHDGQTAVWVIAEGGRAARECSTREAERLAEQIADSVQIYWRPVAHPANKDRYLETRALIAARRRKIGQDPLYHGPAQPDELPI